MSNKFTGFSEDDIKKYKKGDNVISEKTKLRPVLKAKRAPVKKTVTITSNYNNYEEDDCANNIPDDARLSVKKVSKPRIQTEINIEKQVANGHIIETIPAKEKDEQPCLRFNPINSTIDLEEFQAQQKLIEDENKRRKEFLARALADRKKKTHEEVHRLEMIQQEFKKLDTLLSNDVSILRNQIEVASYDFMEAQKRFDKLEKEYNAAKSILQQKRERKILLTEHLCTIIQQNELRKSEKLSALMSKLEISADDIVDNDNNTLVEKTSNIQCDTTKINEDDINKKNETI